MPAWPIGPRSWQQCPPHNQQARRDTTCEGAEAASPPLPMRSLMLLGPHGTQELTHAQGVLPAARPPCHPQLRAPPTCLLMSLRSRSRLSNAEGSCLVPPAMKRTVEDELWYMRHSESLQLELAGSFLAEEAWLNTLRAVWVCAHVQHPLPKGWARGPEVRGWREHACPTHKRCWGRCSRSFWSPPISDPATGCQVNVLAARRTQVVVLEGAMFPP